MTGQPLDYLYRLEQEDKERKSILASYKKPVFDTTYKAALAEALTHDPIVIAPYVHSYPEHVEAINHVGYPVTRIPCPEEDSYYKLLVALYKTGKPLVVIEHDMIPRPTDVQALLDCPEPWCGFLYTHRYQRKKACLGLTKLNMHDKLPKIFKNVSHDWRYLDGTLEAMLWVEGMTIHEHLPEAVHINPLVAVDGPGLDSSPEGLMLRSIFLSRNNTTLDALP